MIAKSLLVGLSALALFLFIAGVVAALVSSLVIGRGPSIGGGSVPSAEALADIPDNYLRYYRDAAALCPGLDWSILAGVGKTESDHGRSRLPGVHDGQNAAGAKGPMQFLQATFDAVVSRHQLRNRGPLRTPSPYEPGDAIAAAAFLLCDNGARDGDNVRRALWTYNHSEEYVTHVLDVAARYAAPPRTPDVTRPGPATTAISYASAQLGRPYQWGGNGPSNGNAGFDCSGLTHAAYAAAGIDLSRTADAQMRAGPRLPRDAQLEPGDLVFYGTSATATHVALYIGNNRVIQAPNFGQQVEQTPLQVDHYLGATRPADQLTGSSLGTGAFMLRPRRLSSLLGLRLHTPTGVMAGASGAGVQRETNSANSPRDTQVWPYGGRL